MGSARSAEVLISQPEVKRRYRSKEERRQIVEETLQPGASVAVIARQHGVNANQVFLLCRKGLGIDTNQSFDTASLAFKRDPPA